MRYLFLIGLLLVFGCGEGTAGGAGTGGGGIAGMGGSGGMGGHGGNGGVGGIGGSADEPKELRFNTPCWDGWKATSDCWLSQEPEWDGGDARFGFNHGEATDPTRVDACTAILIEDRQQVGVLGQCTDVTADTIFFVDSWINVPIGYLDIFTEEGAWYTEIRLYWESR